MSRTPLAPPGIEDASPAPAGLRFKLATEDWELAAIHRLNHRTFVEEIPQHEGSPSGVLIDKFHDENTYFVALAGDRLVGMMALRGERPFSLDAKLADLDRHLPAGRRVCEVRLLAVEPEYRNGRVFRGLAQVLSEAGRRLGYDLAVISGTTRQAKLYRHLGFVPFGPLLGKEGAWFQPMYLTLEAFEAATERVLPPPEPVNLLPGPVAIRREVREALARPPVSHRGTAFRARFSSLQDRLRKLTGAHHVQLLLGSGTLANDAVAGQLSRLGEPGLVLVNGEFGRRLVDHARRWGLGFEAHEMAWGEPFALEPVARRLASEPRLGWLWAVHHETSTGQLNDVAGLSELCRSAGVRLCLDAISSLGTVPVDLAGVFLASGVGSKGLGSYPGIALVFHEQEVTPAPDSLPRYLDLGFYAAEQGVPFTHSSNLLAALSAALDRPSWDERFAALRATASWLRAELRGAGFEIVGRDELASPATVTLALPPDLDSQALGHRLERAGFLLSYASGYLVARNWIQICLMGEVSRPDLERALAALTRLGRRAGTAATE